MRTAFALVFFVGGLASAQEKIAPRFGVEADTDRFPQKSARDTLRSVLGAIEAKRVDYVLAHLAEPAFVDERVRQVGGRFEVMVRETTAKLQADPESVRDLRRLLAEGTWVEEDATASVSLKDLPGRSAFFKKLGTRWFFENRQTTPPAKGS
jgi:hypothetical protein